MDWLDEAAEWLKKKLDNLSVKAALVAYILLGTGAALCLSVMLISWAYEWRTLIEDRYGIIGYKYKIDEDYVYETRSDGDLRDEDLLTGDRIFLKALLFIEDYGVFVCVLGALIATALFFYKERLETPLTIVKSGASRISRNDLDFRVIYDRKDEMGELCRTFEEMRQQLILNNREVWHMMEQQKHVNAAFAHDLRTPLTVLHGYADILQKYYPAGRVSEEKLLHTIELMSGQIKRLEQFAKTMKEICSLDDIQPDRKLLSTDRLCLKIRGMLPFFEQESGIAIQFTWNIKEKQIYADEKILTEVLENMLINSLRYGRQHIEVMAEYTGENLSLYVRDDGPGFSREALDMADKPFYTGSGSCGDKHFGMGLAICRILCEKHGGFLSFANSIKGGAIVTAVFHSIENSS